MPSLRMAIRQRLDCLATRRRHGQTYAIDLGVFSYKQYPVSNETQLGNRLKKERFADIRLRRK
eukprot:4661561-Amphidinium_carterae.1